MRLVFIQPGTDIASLCLKLAGLFCTLPLHEATARRTDSLTAGDAKRARVNIEKIVKIAKVVEH